MGHKDSQWLPLPHGLTGGAEHVTGHSADGDAFPASVGELGDAADGHWWNAWIDHGGEG
jgi:hypothetical protein